MSQIGAVLKALPVFGRLLERLLDWLDERKAKQRQEERKDAHEQIDASPDDALVERGWMREGRRQDGAYPDYPLSGPTGALRPESDGRVSGDGE